MKFTVLASVLGLSIWTMGCGEPASPNKPISPVKTGGEAGSTKGGGTDVPAAEGDAGAKKPAEDKPADADKPAAEEKKEEPKAEEAKKEDAPADKKE